MKIWYPTSKSSMIQTKKSSLSLLNCGSPATMKISSQSGKLRLLTFYLLSVNWKSTSVAQKWISEGRFLYFRDCMYSSSRKSSTSMQTPKMSLIAWPECTLISMMEITKLRKNRKIDLQVTFNHQEGRAHNISDICSTQIVSHTLTKVFKRR